MQLHLKDLPAQERPRERLLQFGAESLSLQELLEIVLAQGSQRSNVLQISHNLLSRYGSLEKLRSSQLNDLYQIPGVGKAKAAQLHAVIELGRRLFIEEVMPPKASIFDSSKAHSLVSSFLRDKKQEHVMLFCLDARMRLIAKPEVLFKGTLNSSVLHAREVFASAIKNHSALIILAHNHPSGSAEPSGQDLETTKSIIAAGKIMDIPLLDHIVIGGGNYYSFRVANPELFD